MVEELLESLLGRRDSGRRRTLGLRRWLGYDVDEHHNGGDDADEEHAIEHLGDRQQALRRRPVFEGQLHGRAAVRRILGVTGASGCDLVGTGTSATLLSTGLMPTLRCVWGQRGKTLKFCTRLYRAIST